VLLHELTHNVHSDHDEHFKALNSQLNNEYKEYMGSHAGGRSVAGGPIAPARDDLSSAVDVTDGRVLGHGGEGSQGEAPISAREAAARAAAARAAPRPADGAELACVCGACSALVVCVVCQD